MKQMISTSTISKTFKSFSAHTQYNSFHTKTSQIITSHAPYHTITILTYNPNNKIFNQNCTYSTAPPQSQNLKLKLLKPLRAIFFGPPGVGKGTYARRVGPIFGVPAISTGDLIRYEIFNKTELGKKIQAAHDSGQLVSDELVLEIMKSRLSQADAKNGFIVDGYPRTLKQANQFDQLMKKMPINLVLNLELREDLLVQKLAARRVCINCGDLYNLAHIKEDGIDMPPMLPKKENTCDKCGGNLIKRKDDDEAVIKDRLVTYNKETSPILDYYKNKGIVTTFKVVGTSDTIILKVANILKDFVEKKK